MINNMICFSLGRQKDKLMKTKVSIIVPTLNEENCIENLLNSLQKQTYKGFETIVVDGGSKDNTINIAKKYGARVIVKEKCGEFESRNLGAEIARGNILINTCADVIFPNDLIERVVRYFSIDKDLVALSGPGIPHNHPPLWAKIELGKIYFY